MKRLLTILTFVTTTAFAGPNGYHGSALHTPHHRSGGWGWMAPAVVGGVVVYAITRPLVVQQPPVMSLSPSDVVYIDGVPYRKQLVLHNGYYQEVLVRM
jgi:hypothetical protein